MLVEYNSLGLTDTRFIPPAGTLKKNVSFSACNFYPKESTRPHLLKYIHTNQYFIHNNYMFPTV